jgi:carboxypeptidase Taq
MNTADLYNEYKTKMQKIADVKYASAVLQWDQETYLPPKGNELRGKQIATLSEMAHQQFTDEKVGVLLNELSGRNDLADKEKRNIQLSLEDYIKAKKFTSDFVRKMSEATNKSFHAWIRSRKENSFAAFEKPLHDLIQLK